MNYNDYTDPKIVAIKLAQTIQQDIASTTSCFNWALSGGNSAPLLYETLTSEPFASSIDWSKVRFFFTYEYMGRRANSNVAQAYAYLFEKLNVKEEQIFAINPEAADLNQEAERYRSVVEEQVPQIGGYPRFDLALLEIGDDGRTAGVFPGQMEMFVAEDVYLPNKNIKTKEQVITLTLAALEESKKIIFFTTGPEARFVLGDILNLMPEAKEYPANFLAAKCPWAHLFADAQAMREKSYSIY